MTCLTLWERIWKFTEVAYSTWELIAYHNDMSHVMGKNREELLDMAKESEVVKVGLLRRALIGDELIDKEKQALRRTMTDLATVVPISFLMLLPISSTYGTERLDLLRQLEKVKQLESTDVNPTEIADI